MNRWLALTLVLAACGSPCGRAPAATPTVAETDKEASRTVTRRSIIVDDVARLTWKAGQSAVYRPTTLVEREAVTELVPARHLQAQLDGADQVQGRPARRRHDQAAGRRLVLVGLERQPEVADVEGPRPVALALVAQGRHAQPLEA